MRKENKLYLFKDREDYIKELTNDSIINIIGTKGSGKTTTSIEYIKNDDYIVVNCDKLFELPSEEVEDKQLTNIRKMLKDKYGNILDGEEFSKCYNDIINYILKRRKKGLIEGNVIQDINPIILKGTIIIKRTGVFKSFIRAVKRDYSNKYFMDLEKESHKYLYKIIRLYKIIKRRTKIFKQSKEIENIINEINNG